MSPYPPGWSHRDEVRAGIVDDRPECRECGERIGDASDHADGCPSDMDRNDIAEAREHEAATEGCERL